MATRIPALIQLSDPRVAAQLVYYYFGEESQKILETFVTEMVEAWDEKKIITHSEESSEDGYQEKLSTDDQKQDRTTHAH